MTGRRRVYPRACGGTPVLTQFTEALDGLSPRVRGNRLDGELGLQFVRSIPARAGEPPHPATGSPARRVYPRACGGTSWTCTTPAAEMGLSPRVRGNRRLQGLTGGCMRSIPARAGEPSPISRTWRKATVYPRACGGTETKYGERVIMEGLSPRVRGNRSGIASDSLQLRSIPARAGEPRLCRRCHRTRWVYPRACGGTVWAVQWPLIHAGLSPRVRGNQ